ncbi:3-hydroxybenzoate 6-hydroxylase 1 [Triticum urartu]|uniref:3-hydroxybenzoate 6-hydroxylase 1 n=1 Tax=Triticum urartu TaxID=4572 RepID=M7Z5R4_TRIUA|nr:3-hydroxybenzoate 6-hydroxylase 1 [Triticum urartu]
MAPLSTFVSSPARHPCSDSYHRRRRGAVSASSSSSSTKAEEVVIVGAGIAGLATALSLRRLGVSATVLEQGPSLRAGGTSLTLFKNGWRVLDSIGVADELRAKYLRVQGMRMRSSAGGRDLREFSFEEEAPGQEVRAVERGALLATMASKLPPGAISFSSRLKSIAGQGPDGTLLELQDGRRLLSKVVLGCDGVNSPIARWMGFSEPRYVGHMAFRGLADYAGGQPVESKSKVNYIYGRGVRAGFVPVSPTKVYWFICFNSATPGPKATDGAALKREALGLLNKPNTTRTKEHKRHGRGRGRGARQTPNQALEEAAGAVATGRRPSSEGLKTPPDLIWACVDSRLVESDAVKKLLPSGSFRRSKWLLEREAP